MKTKRDLKHLIWVERKQVLRLFTVPLFFRKILDVDRCSKCRHLGLSMERNCGEYKSRPMGG